MHINNFISLGQEIKFNHIDNFIVLAQESTSILAQYSLVFTKLIPGTLNMNIRIQLTTWSIDKSSKLLIFFDVTQKILGKL